VDEVPDKIDLLGSESDTRRDGLSSSFDGLVRWIKGADVARSTPPSNNINSPKMAYGAPT